MITELFPTFLYFNQLTPSSSYQIKLNRDLLRECIKYSEIDKSGQKWSKTNYPGGYTSYGSLAQLHKMSSTFEILNQKIDFHVRKFARHMEMDIDLKSLKMTSCWINIMPNHVTHSMHIHPLSVISGTYYVSTPKNCSHFKIEDPRMGHFMASPPRKPKAHFKNQRFYSIKPKTGNVVLFESWMKHEVPFNQASSSRVSISFNYDWL